MKEVHEDGLQADGVLEGKHRSLTSDHDDGVEIRDRQVGDPRGLFKEGDKLPALEILILGKGRRYDFRGNFETLFKVGMGLFGAT